MGRSPKIDFKLLSEYLERGMSRKEIAKKFDVTEKSISRAKKKLREQVTKVTVMEAAPVIVKKNLDTVDQLNRINRDTQAILDEAMGRIGGDKECCIRVPETQIKKVKRQNPSMLALRAIAEIRKQILLQIK